MVKNFRAFCRRFVDARKGNVAIIFGFSMIPVMVLIGGIVDYGMAIKTKSQLTATLDAAMLAAMLQYAEDPDVDYQKIIEDYINKNFTQSDKRLHGTIIEISTAEITEEGEMKASVTAKVPTSFLKFAHLDDFEFTIGSGVMVGGSSIEIALVLDNTGSMKGSKLTALKNATNDLLDIIYPEDFNNSDEKIKFSVVPFANYVNIGVKDGGTYNVVGRSDRNEPGLDIPDDYTRTWWVEGHNDCWNEYPNSTEECEPVKEWRTCYNDGVPYDCLKTVDWNCTGDPGEPVEHCEWVEGVEKRKNYKWKGCMGSRDADHRTRDEDYDVKVPGMMMEYNMCKDTATLTRLTSDRDAIVSGLSKMKARYNTYIPAGLMWGWRTLSPNAPFADGSSYDSEVVRKVIVLMTDGANTRKAWGKWNGLENDDKAWKRKLGWRSLHNTADVYGHNSSWHAAQYANATTAELCTNIKAKNIMVYTIGFEIEADSEIENLMKSCAGNGGKYFDADDSTELADAFKEIGKSLLNLRLTH